MAKIIPIEQKDKATTDELIISYQGAVSLKITEHDDLILEQMKDDPTCSDPTHSIIIRRENIEQFILAIKHFCAERGINVD